MKRKLRNIIFHQILFIVFSFAIPLPSPAQDSSRVQVSDSSLSLLRLPEQPVLFTQSFEYSLLAAEPSHVFSKYFGTPAFQSAPVMDWTLQSEIDLIQPWKLNLAQQQKYSAVNIVFSGAATGGALYLAYRHIKKYGFW
ncbi:MAG: hypothetical protein HYV29_14070 [Ignavibacteriales bacterium]|nr:hypothetical protein [Ignavibacteriales bacterium]